MKLQRSLLLSLFCLTTLAGTQQTQAAAPTKLFYPKHQPPRALLDRAIGFFYPTILVRRLYEMVNYLSWGQTLDHAKYSWIYSLVAELCKDINLPMPKLNTLSHTELNAALWTGKINVLVYGWEPEDSSITITHYALELLTREELRAFLAQALAQIKVRQNAFSKLMCSPNPIEHFLLLDVVRNQILLADYNSALATKALNPLENGIKKEFEHAGLPYIVGSLPILSWFSNWPTAENRLRQLSKLTGTL